MVLICKKRERFSVFVYYSSPLSTMLTFYLLKRKYLYLCKQSIIFFNIVLITLLINIILNRNNNQQYNKTKIESAVFKELVIHHIQLFTSIASTNTAKKSAELWILPTKISCKNFQKLTFAENLTFSCFFQTSLLSFNCSRVSC